MFRYFFAMRDWPFENRIGEVPEKRESTWSSPPMWLATPWPVRVTLDDACPNVHAVSFRFNGRKALGPAAISPAAGKESDLATSNFRSSR
jgi:hypothetical protein